MKKSGRLSKLIVCRPSAERFLALTQSSPHERRANRRLILKPHRFLAALVAVIASLTLSACGGGDDDATPGTTITTLSNRADLVSGGSALVEVKVPGGTRPASLRVDRDGTDITSSFTTLPSGRIVGLVTGLADGANTINASFTDNSFRAARLVITNHPK